MISYSKEFWIGMGATDGDVSVVIYKTLLMKYTAVAYSAKLIF